MSRESAQGTDRFYHGKKPVVYYGSIVERDDGSPFDVLLLAHFPPLGDQVFANDRLAYLPALVNGGSIAASFLLLTLVLRVGNRLRWTAATLGTTGTTLIATVQRLHNVRGVVGNWWGLAPTEKSVLEVQQQLDKSMTGLSAHIMPTLWLQRTLSDWYGATETTDILRVMTDVVTTSNHPLAKSITIRSDDAIMLPIFEDDANSICRNLVENACKHGGPPIDITVKRAVGVDVPPLEIIVTNRLAADTDESPPDDRKHYGKQTLEQVAAKYGGTYSGVERRENGTVATRVVLPFDRPVRTYRSFAL